MNIHFFAQHEFHNAAELKGDRIIPKLRLVFNLIFVILVALVPTDRHELALHDHESRHLERPDLPPELSLALVAGWQLQIQTARLNFGPLPAAVGSCAFVASLANQICASALARLLIRTGCCFDDDGDAGPGRRA